ncbi:uncharacterized protein METZ01_LOCUS257586 [marine metagenome]|uniref:Prephenate/arogenate dehydrogenase domain-containing protein n=1 Tax=marine metagenome TaxID=408172 RepID=A0A382IZY8_9ZZZZ
MDKPVRALPVIQPGQSSDTPLVFEKVAVVGLGLIGGSIALASRQVWPKCLVIGVDNKTVLEQAMVRHAIDIAADDLVVIAEADVVILASPVRQNISLLAELTNHIKGSAVVTDVSSTKREIVAASQHLPDRLKFVGGHPLGGAPRGGFQHARGDLFRDRPWLFTPTAKTPNGAVAQLRDFAGGLGAVPYVMRADEHDQLLAFLSHLPQVTASALMHVVGSSIGAEGLRLTGRGLADTTRLASSPPDIWRDICATNSDVLATALDVLIEQLQEVRNDLDGGESITRVFESAGRWRDVLAAEHGPQKNKG